MGVNYIKAKYEEDNEVFRVRRLKDITEAAAGQAKEVYAVGRNDYRKELIDNQVNFDEEHSSINNLGNTGKVLVYIPRIWEEK